MPYQPNAFEVMNVPQKFWGTAQWAQPAQPAQAKPAAAVAPNNFTYNGVNPMTTPKASAPMLGVQNPMMQGPVGQNTNPSLMNPFVSQLLAGQSAPSGGYDLARVFQLLGIQR